ncbi:glutamate racemase [Candidatus Methylomicrobium oryzae]|uniref:glutamate racemase n=1 Tax=Candidatus Methylomicrobium oryzae TaxID=2802053 RepID=UPI003F50A896
MAVLHSNADPVGVFDSGVGGLSVLSEIRRQLPAENLIYVADSGHAPYGDKPRAFIEKRSLAITRFLLDRGAKAIVVACNTATGAAAASLRTRFTLPIVAMEPAIKPAAAQTRTGVVGVLATSRTLASHNFVKLFERYGSEAEILPQACPGLVEQVEAGELAGEKTRSLLERYLAPLLIKGADTLVLGCTHYPFLRALIQEIAGPNVAVIDSSEAVARQLCRRLEAHGLLNDANESGSERFWTSADPATTGPVITQLWCRNASVERLPEAEAHKAPELTSSP